MLYHTKSEAVYPVRSKLPVAKFYYKGKSHSHPVRRTILIIESDASYITGYELREGSEVRSFHKAPVKTFLKSKIAKVNQCGFRLRNRVPQKYHENSTLEIMSPLELVKHGV